MKSANFLPISDLARSLTWQALGRSRLSTGRDICAAGLIGAVLALAYLVSPWLSLVLFAGLVVVLGAYIRPVLLGYLLILSIVIFGCI